MCFYCCPKAQETSWTNILSSSCWKAEWLQIGQHKIKNQIKTLNKKTQKKIKKYKKGWALKAVPLLVVSEVKGVQVDIQLQVQIWQIRFDWKKLLTPFPRYIFVVIIKNLLQSPMYYIISSLLSDCDTNT